MGLPGCNPKKTVYLEAAFEACSHRPDAESRFGASGPTAQGSDPVAGEVLLMNNERSKLVFGCFSEEENRGVGL